ncbi:OmpH family outer membrane protein [Marinoscillum furvescens]|uniref:Periplasmic chaperone for outer membrane proteins Skp n=1 Tax=Marinoscillum furvescens DSM 4134 TaxID=1122208 RepID=A0A3D9L878_MARFU|nr:OmpH family outer membrane protein [Marinoscillum furvescens]REE01685.1 periplasmic chaperone for outer membrane proteins Skp [Marinoscillum furvescens DSM 4134]
MKKFPLLTILFLLFSAISVFGQKFGYVDTQYVLSRMPEYKEAQAEIEKLAKGWEAEIQEMYKQAEEMEAALKAEEVLLTAEMKEERRQEIDREWKEVKEHQKQIFGFDGLYFLKKKELIKPVQDQVFDAVERVAKNNRLQIVFDKSGDLVMIYTDPIHDYTDYVLEELGLGENNGESNTGRNNN